MDKTTTTICGWDADEIATPYLYKRMNKPNFNPNTMDIFTKSGREKYDQYMKEKQETQDRCKAISPHKQ